MCGPKHEIVQVLFPLLRNSAFVPWSLKTKKRDWSLISDLLNMDTTAYICSYAQLNNRSYSYFDSPLETSHRQIASNKAHCYVLFFNIMTQNKYKNRPTLFWIALEFLHILLSPSTFLFGHFLINGLLQSWKLKLTYTCPYKLII